MFRPIQSLLFCCLSVFAFAQSQNALHFDGSDDYVQTSYVGVTGKSDRTFEAWIYLTDSNLQYFRPILDYGTHVVQGGRNTFWVETNRAISYWSSSGNNAWIRSTGNAVPVHQWVHVAFVLDNGTGYIYVNGKQVATGNLSAVNTPTYGTKLRIGKRVPQGTNTFLGKIDEVRIWSHARTQAQLDSFKNVEICGRTNGLAAYYRFNQGFADSINKGETVLPDRANYTYNGTLNNFNLNDSTSNWVKGVNITLAPDIAITGDTLVCDQFTTPQGRSTSVSGTLKDTFTNLIGCDSIVRYKVTIGNSYVFDEQEACDSFRTVKGILKTASSIYDEVFTNTNGCDSTVQTLLTIYKSQTIQQNIERCYSYTSPSGKVWTQSGLYFDSLTSINGCDSVLAINLIIRKANSAVVYDTACYSYKGPLGNVYTKSGTYIETIRNQYLCDSVVTLNLVINQPTDSVLTASNCDSFTSESGRNTWFTSGIYSEDFKNINGCDSTVEYDLTILKATTGSTSIAACDFFISPDEDTVYTSGEYVYTITNAAGCDSVLTVDLRVVDNSPTITLANNVLITQQDYDAYEWLNCDEGFAPVPNASNFSYRPTVSGDYAVVVYDANCPDTSDCFNYPRTAGVNDLAFLEGSVYPNPATSNLSFYTNKPGLKELVIMNEIGQTVMKTRINSEANELLTLDISKLSNGSYTLSILTDNTIERNKFVKL